jgi:hypothetical protein
VKASLRDQPAGPGLEPGAVLVRPAVALANELAAVIVEGVADLVTDHVADGAVIGRVVGIRIEEWRLQNPRGKHDLVAVCAVVGVDGLRRGVPLATLDLPAELGEPIIIVESARA